MKQLFTLTAAPAAAFLALALASISTPAGRPEPARSVSGIYYGVAAYAQFVGKNYSGAITLAREATRHRGDLTGAYRVLTVAAGMAGQIDVAEAALADLRRTQPNISLAWIATQLPWKLDADREHYLEGFRRAGLQ